MDGSFLRLDLRFTLLTPLIAPPKRKSIMVLNLVEGLLLILNRE